MQFTQSHGRQRIYKTMLFKLKSRLDITKMSHVKTQLDKNGLKLANFYDALKKKLTGKMMRMNPVPIVINYINRIGPDTTTISGEFEMTYDEGGEQVTVGIVCKLLSSTPISKVIEAQDFTISTLTFIVTVKHTSAMSPCTLR